jgi:hypothetical protein
VKEQRKLKGHGLSFFIILLVAGWRTKEIERIYYVHEHMLHQILLNFNFPLLNYYWNSLYFFLFHNWYALQATNYSMIEVFKFPHF